MNNITLLEKQPYFISGAIRSQAATLQRSQSRSELQESCLLASITSFQKVHGSKCFAKPETILNTYNRHCSKFNLRQIGVRTLFTIQGRLIKKQLISVVGSFDSSRCTKSRKITINLEQFKSKFSAAFKLAAYRAASKVKQVLQLDLEKEETARKASDYKASQQSEQSENCTINRNTSNEDLNNNNQPTDDFYIKRFGTDAEQAKELQQMARCNAINGHQARSLMALHEKHHVTLAGRFKAFLVQVIISDREDYAAYQAFQAF